MAVSILGLLEKCDLGPQGLSHRKVNIKFAEGGGDLRDPIDVFANWVVSEHARRVRSSL